MARIASLLFAIVAYAIFFATFLYLIAFVGDFGLVPKTVDEGSTSPLALAVIVNIGLIALFGVQHSVMARPAFKRWWTRIVPPPIERSVFVLAASAALMILFALWQPISTVIWDATGTPLEVPLWVLFGIGWMIVLLSTFLINHFELFGLQQAWFHLRRREAPPPKLRQPLFYRWVAHPLYSGFFLAFWATPQMTSGHLLLALGMSTYMLIAIRYEEHDLKSLFGREYVEYRAGVGKLVPRLRRRTS